MRKNIWQVEKPDENIRYAGETGRIQWKHTFLGESTIL